MCPGCSDPLSPHWQLPAGSLRPCVQFCEPPHLSERPHLPLVLVSHVLDVPRPGSPARHPHGGWTSSGSCCCWRREECPGAPGASEAEHPLGFRLPARPLALPAVLLHICLLCWFLTFLDTLEQSPASARVFSFLGLSLSVCYLLMALRSSF